MVSSSRGEEMFLADDSDISEASKKSGKSQILGSNLKCMSTEQYPPFPPLWGIRKEVNMPYPPALSLE